MAWSHLWEIMRSYNHEIIQLWEKPKLWDTSQNYSILSHIYTIKTKKYLIPSHNYGKTKSYLWDEKLKLWHKVINISHLFISFINTNYTHPLTGWKVLYLSRLNSPSSTNIFIVKHFLFPFQMRVEYFYRHYSADQYSCWFCYIEIWSWKIPQQWPQATFIIIIHDLNKLQHRAGRWPHSKHTISMIIFLMFQVLH